MKLEIIETVSRLFLSADERNWEQLEQIFSGQVLLDYTSMAGGEPALLKPEQIIAAWKSVLPGFTHTHHQLGNFLVQTEGAKANAFCYGTATHYLPNETGNNLWTVVGSYEFELVNQAGTWQVTKMKLNLKYTDGNNDLPRLAQEKLKG